MPTPHASTAARALAALLAAAGCTDLHGLQPAPDAGADAAAVVDAPEPVGDAPMCPSGSRTRLDPRGATMLVVNALHPWFNAAPRGAFLDAQGRPVVLGACNNCVGTSASRAALWRLPTVTNRVDTSFGTAGRAYDGTLAEHARTWLTGAVDGTGRLVVGGYQEGAATTQAVVARFSADGVPDATYGASGRVVIPSERFSGGGSTFVPYAQLTAGGATLLVGAELPPQDGAPTRALAARLDDAGALDESFGARGTLRDDALRGCFDVEADGDGYVLACRSASGRPALLRLDRRGAPAPFANGRAATEHGGASTGFRPTTLERDSAGRWVVAGSISDLDSDEYPVPAVVRFRADGSADGSYGAGGVAQIPGVRRTYQTALAASARLTCEDRMLVGVEVEGRPAVAVFGADGLLDETVGARGLLPLRAQGADDGHTYVFGLLGARVTADVIALAWYNLRSFDVARVAQ
jgi:uncharacterized delta-60 repeat protein